MIAIAAQIGEQTVQTEDADAFARQLAEASREVNYAAADAGFGVTTGTGTIPTCTIDRGVRPRATPSPYTADDLGACAGYYVNFESHLIHIEGRVIRAMLTSLPTDKARKFLEKLSGGDVLSALWALTRTFGDLALAFHTGAGVYRAGTENLAAVTSQCYGDPSYSPRTAPFDEEWETVLVAAQCLGLSRADLFDGDSITAGRLPVKLPPKAFHAMFRIARAACVGLPLENSTDESFVIESRKNRQQSCSLVRFAPQTRPLDLEIPEASDAGTGTDTDTDAAPGDAQPGPAVAQAPTRPEEPPRVAAPPP